MKIVIPLMSANFNNSLYWKCIQRIVDHCLINFFTTADWREDETSSREAGTGRAETSAVSEEGGSLTHGGGGATAEDGSPEQGGGVARLSGGEGVSCGAETDGQWGRTL